MWSQSPQAGQFNSYKMSPQELNLIDNRSQSPQAGQFNSYKIAGSCVNFVRAIVSIPSSGSIQFLPIKLTQM